MAKLVENAFRDVNIGFANEVDNICRKLGISGEKHPCVYGWRGRDQQ